MSAPMVLQADGGQPSHEVQCWRCHKRLMMATSGYGKVETKCPRCKAVNVVVLTASG